MGFQDHFSGHASEYAKRRPTYPGGLFAWLAGAAPSNRCAWDCATGNGQAAVALAGHFEQVFGTDASAQQIDNARPADGVSYRVAPAEACGLPDASCDLVTVAQALHWFDLPAFYREVHRVSKPGGVIAAWSYELATVDPEIDGLVEEFYRGEISPYWPEGRRDVESRYRDLDFPFARIDAPEFAMSQRWAPGEMLDYLRTWSAVQRYRREHGRDPVDDLDGPITAAWGAGRREVSWPLTVLAGRVG